jgi:hypothetical protein
LQKIKEFSRVRHNKYFAARSPTQTIQDGVIGTVYFGYPLRAGSLVITSIIHLSPDCAMTIEFLVPRTAFFRKIIAERPIEN